jgi:sugar lactone lactonase YvrE
VFIADTGNHRVRWITEGQLRAYAGNGTQGFHGNGGLAPAARLHTPAGIAVDSAGRLYIADSGNRRIRVVNPTTAIITTFAGTGLQGNTGDGGLATAARLDAPVAVAVDATDDVYIVDRAQHRVRKVTRLTGNIAAFAGSGTQGFLGDGGGAGGARLDTPRGIASGGAAIYIADGGNHRVRRVSGGNISSPIGDGNNADAGDANQLATAARLNAPGGMALDTQMNILYFADSGNNRVRKVNLVSGIISLCAGDGTAGFLGDGGSALAARLNNPTDVAYDVLSNTLYICDRGNQRIRKLDLATGLISTVCGDGTAGWTGNGGAANLARINQPQAIALDIDGNLYIATVGDHRVRKITLTTGFIGPFAGTGAQGFTGDAGAATGAQLDTPNGLSVDNAGVVYISCNGSHRVRKVDGGTITTVAGSGANGFAGDGGLPTAAQLNAQQGVAVDPAGRNLFIADTANRRVRRACL